MKAEFDDLDDIMVTTGTAFLGLTIGCARCHDHKFDPIRQADYYSMLSFIRSIDGYGLQHTGGGGRGTGKIQRLLATKAEMEKWEAEKRRRVKEVEQRLAQASDTETETRIEAELKQAREAAAPFDYALAVAENGPRPKATHVLARGDAFSPKAEVFRVFQRCLGFSAGIPGSFCGREDHWTPSRARRLDRQPAKPAHRARDGEPDLAETFRCRYRAHAG